MIPEIKYEKNDGSVSSEIKIVGKIDRDGFRTTVTYVTSTVTVMYSLFDTKLDPIAIFKLKKLK